MKRLIALTALASASALPAFADAGGIDSTVFLAAIFRACLFRRLLRRVERDTSLAHPTHGCDKRDFLGDHRRRTRGRRDRWFVLRQLDFQGAWYGGGHPCQREHIWRLPRHPAHAGHVQEKRRLMAWR